MNTIFAPRFTFSDPVPVRLIITVSSDSSIRSSVIWSEMNPCVLPDGITNVSAGKVKSTPPPVAVPPVTAYAILESFTGSGLLKTTLILIGLTFSTFAEPVLSNSAVLGLSLSFMINVCVVSFPINPIEGLERVNMIVSSVSTFASSTTSISTVLSTEPTLNVIVPSERL